MVLYRKYRPQTLEELFAQPQVVSSLTGAFNSGKLAHAYLFFGPRGTGKTSTARILAKMVNCQKQGNSVPCNECSSCLAITDGSFMDLIEIDAASNRGIDDIRALRETIKLSPTQASKKVYIIDEVHMLTNEAFNALLKTLEEPPSHVLFILATTEIQKIPQTILSRVQRLDFRLAKTEEIASKLTEIAKLESIKIDDEAVSALAVMSGGSFRDGIKLLDQVSSLEKVSASEINKIFGRTQLDLATQVLTLISQSNSQEAIKLFLESLNQGGAVKDFLQLSLELLRQILLIHNGLSEDLVKPNNVAAQFHNLVELSKQLDLDKTLATIEAYQKAVESLKNSPLPTLPVEVAIVSSCTQKMTEAIPETPQDMAQLPTLIIKAESQPTPKAVISLPRSDDWSLTTSDGDNDHGSDEIVKIKERWQYVLETIRPQNYSLEALLRTVKLVGCQGNVIEIEVPYSFHQRILQTAKSRELLEAVLSDVVGKAIRIEVTLGKHPPKKEELANVELAQDDEIIRIASEIFSSDAVN